MSLKKVKIPKGSYIVGGGCYKREVHTMTTGYFAKQKNTQKTTDNQVEHHEQVS